MCLVACEYSCHRLKRPVSGLAGFGADASIRQFRSDLLELQTTFPHCLDFEKYSLLRRVLDQCRAVSSEVVVSKNSRTDVGATWSLKCVR